MTDMFRILLVPQKVKISPPDFVSFLMLPIFTGYERCIWKDNDNRCDPLYHSSSIKKLRDESIQMAQAYLGNIPLVKFIKLSYFLTLL